MSISYSAIYVLVAHSFRKLEQMQMTQKTMPASHTRMASKVQTAAAKLW